MAELFHSPKFYYTWGFHSPAIEVDSGSTLRIACPDSDNAQADGSPLPDDRRQTSDGSPLFTGNPLAGPIAIRHVEPGDCVAIVVKDIELDRRQGATLLAPDHGLLSRDQLFGASAKNDTNAVPRHMYEWKIDGHSKVADVANPLGGEAIRVPLRPMIGSIGVCPPWGQSISSLYAGDFGGNMDLPLVRPGATLFLPALCPGGHVLVGDIHAAQGAGEIVGGGIETSGVVTLTLGSLRDRPISSPRMIVDGHLFSVATYGDLRTAVSTAYSHLLDWIATEGALDRWDAHQLISQVGRLEIGGISSTSSTVAAGIAIDLLPSNTRRELAPWIEFAGQ